MLPLVPLLSSWGCWGGCPWAGWVFWCCAVLLRRGLAMAGLGPSTPRSGARAKSQKRDGEQGERVPWGWERVPCSPTTPGKGRLVRRQLEENRPGPASAPPCPGEREPETSLLLPCPGSSYFSGYPEDEHRDLTIPAAPSLLTPGVLTPNMDSPRRTRSTLEHTLVLELDGTLLCSSILTDEQDDTMATFTSSFQGISYKVQVKLRPHVQQFLESLSKTYEIFIYTTAKQDYAKKLLDVLDPRKKLIRRCFSQSDCVCSRGCYWKDLTRLGKDLAKIVALDHTIQGFPAQAANWISVPQWCGDPQDEELLRLIPLLRELGQAEDVRPDIQRQFQPCQLPTKD